MAVARFGAWLRGVGKYPVRSPL